MSFPSLLMDEPWLGLLQHALALILRELTFNAAALERRFADIHTLSYAPSYDHCVQVATEFLSGLPK